MRTSESESAVRLTMRYGIAFALLSLLMHELHELAHTIVGRLMCGGWGPRDFNSWQLVDGCLTYVPTTIGPLFSYGVMFTGMWLIASGRSRPLGIALALTPNPFARLLTAAMGGGDELVVARVLAGTGKTPLLRMLVIAVVAALSLPAIVAAWRALAGTRRRGLWFVALLLLPTLLTGVLYLVIGNRLLAAGLLVTPQIAGAPLLVFMTTVLAAALTAATARWLVTTRPVAP